MPTPQVGLYTFFTFDKEEELVAQTFNYLQQCFLQNLRYEAIQTRDRLIVDFKCPEDYFYQKAQLDGQIDVLTYLIELLPATQVTTTEG